MDIEKILIACAAHGVAVEVNANPWRLDLDWRWHRRAVELGCWMSINPDAHSIAEIDLTHWGVEMARKGAVPKERLLNCLDSGGSWRISSSARLQGHAPRRAPAADQCMSRLLLQRYRERAVILPGVASARPPSQPASTRSMSRLRHSPR
jgi:hypothetical protein